MAHSLTTIGRHLECAIQTELVVEPDIGLPLIGRKQSCRLQYHFVCHMPERYKRVLVGWHCAKVKVA